MSKITETKGEHELENVANLFEWFNNFVDYVQDNHRNIYNEACEYADKIEES